MKPLLILVLLGFFPLLQEVERESDLVVVKFSWAREKQESRMIRGVQNPGGPVNNPISDGRDLGSRKADLRTMDRRAAGSAEKPVDNYQLRLELKNRGANVVRGLIWEYRSTAAPEDYQPKQYLCALEVKPDEKKILEIWTPSLPMKVISADELKNPLKHGSVVINQIHYTDGSVWTKPGWNFKLPAESLQKLTEGNCSVF